MRRTVTWLVLAACVTGLFGCAGDTAELTSQSAQPTAPTSPNDPSQPQAPTQSPARKELPPLGSPPGVAPGAVNPGVWR